MTKPVDIGNARIAASVSGQGKIVSVNFPDPVHGYCKLTPVRSFDNSKWYSPDAVRNYRSLFTSDVVAEKGYGLFFRSSSLNFASDLQTELEWVNGGCVRRRIRAENIVFTQWILIPPGRKMVYQFYRIENRGVDTAELTVEILVHLGLIRASYGQITENGPIPIPATSNRIQCKGGNALLLEESGLGRKIIFECSGPGLDGIFTGTEECHSKGPIAVNRKKVITVEKGQKALFRLAVRILERDESNPIQSPVTTEVAFKELCRQTDVYWKPFQMDCFSRRWNHIINRNIAYVAGCCFITDNGAMITDHQLLPLTWNRDNYFMVMLLHETCRIQPDPGMYDFFSGHLSWLFENLTEDHYWGRSHLVDGTLKDRVYQFDQQCYPLLELAAFEPLMRPEDRDEWRQWLTRIDAIVDGLMEKKGPGCMLFETEENPADDPVLYPYHLSTQILAWRTFRSLHKLNVKWKFSNRDFSAMAMEVRQNVLDSMTTVVGGQELFCYTTDLSGNYELYHDANDLPLALAPLWGFIESDDSIFRNTVKWAFSEENRGYYPGEYGGLGSDHAKAHWPLGTGQLLAIALYEIKNGVEGGQSRWKEALDKLERVVQPDGLFSESVHPVSGEVYSRHWFAWPGAFISSLVLKYCNSR